MVCEAFISEYKDNLNIRKMTKSDTVATVYVWLLGTYF